MLVFLLSSLLGVLSAQSEERTILFLGDSLTAGYGLRPEEAYPALIERRFQAEAFRSRVINGGVSGDTTAGGLRRLPWMLDQAKPDLLVIALGGNDMLRGLDVVRTESNLKKMIQAAQDRSVPVLILGVPAAPNVGEEYEARFNAVFKELEGVPVLTNYVLGVAGKSELNLSDGIHPNAEGHRKLAEAVFDFLMRHVPQNWKESL